MSHLTEEGLLAYLDGELAEPAGKEAKDHLAQCRACRRRYRELRELTRHVSAALELLDPAPPLVQPADIRRRAARTLPLEPARSREAARPRTVRNGGKRRRRALLAAAVLLLAVAGAGATTLASSAARRWVAASVPVVGRLFRAEPPSAPPEIPTAPASLSMGISVDPTAGRIRVLVERPAPGVLVRVRLVEQERASVWAAGATYRTGPGRVEVVRPGPGDVRVELPRTLSSATVEVDGRTMLEKRGADLRLLTPAVDSSGSEISFRAGG
ncbi:MAG: zf-HC2 domain-containing protein [Gemmatimonadota bacterium]